MSRMILLYGCLTFSITLAGMICFCWLGQCRRAGKNLTLIEEETGSELEDEWTYGYCGNMRVACLGANILSFFLPLPVCGE